jgi:hypothetical protein
MKDPRASSGSCGNGSALPGRRSAALRYRNRQKGVLSCSLRSRRFCTRRKTTLRRHQGKGDPGLVVIKEWWSLNDEICEVADRFARAGAPTSRLKLWMPNPSGPVA